MEAWVLALFGLAVGIAGISVAVLGLSFHNMRLIVIQFMRETERIQLLAKSESVEQYTAAESRLSRDRMEEARATVHEGRVLPFGDDVPKKKSRSLDQLWTKPPAGGVIGDAGRRED